MKEVKSSKLEEKELKHKTRRLSIKEGIFWSVRNSFGDQYISPFAIAMGTASPLVAILNSMWNLGPISQLFGSKLVEKYKRKAIFTKTLLLESFAWLIIILTGILYLKNISMPLLPYLTIFGLSLMVFATGLGHPAWFSWMGDIVDAKYRGRWFSKRGTIISFTTTLLAILASLILIYFKKEGNEITGFILLFSTAFIARISCVKIIRKQYEPKLKRKKNNSLKKFIQEIKGTNFGKFTLFRGIFAMTIGLTAPLVSIYLLRDLQFNYLIYILIMLSGTFFSILTLNFWGKIADKYGNYRVIALTTIIIPLTPLLWILSSNKIYLLLVPAILGGTAWTAFIMSSGNFIYDNIKKENRSNAISFFNLFVGLGAFIGGLIGALLLETMQTTWIKPLYLIFIIGTITRMIAVGISIPSINEVRRKQKLKNLKELKDLILKEAKPIITEDIHEIMSIRHYLREK